MYSNSNISYAGRPHVHWKEASFFNIFPQQISKINDKKYQPIKRYHRYPRGCIFGLIFSIVVLLKYSDHFQ